MTLQKREKILAVAVAVLLALVAFYYGGFGMLRGNSTRRGERDRLAAEVAKKQDRVDKAEKTFRQMAAWEDRSLPSDRELAQSLYANWLTQLVEQSKFRRPRVEPTEGRDVRGAYRVFPYTVRGQATLEQLVQFLHAFYSTGHLHQIRHLSMKPLENAKELDLAVTIEAIMLPGADRKDKLTTEPGKGLLKPKIDEYRTLIVDRSPFMPYKPPPDARPPDSRPPEPERPKFDPSKYAYLTGITSKNGQPLAWIVSRITDQTLQLKEGDPLEIGPLKGKIVGIESRQIEVELADGARYRLPLGRSLRPTADAETKPGHEPEKPKPDGNERKDEKKDDRMEKPPERPMDPPRDERDRDERRGSYKKRR